MSMRSIVVLAEAKTQALYVTKKLIEMADKIRFMTSDIVRSKT
jgi:hypothetical protein